jgi:hypothetical protein
MLQCIFFSSVLNDLILYKQAFLLQKEHKIAEQDVDKMSSSDDGRAQKQDS